MTLRRNRKITIEVPPTTTVADRFKTVFGWKPSTTPFHTTANRECGSCHAIKPGSGFDGPVDPEPSRNTCRECSRSG